MNCGNLVQRAEFRASGRALSARADRVVAAWSLIAGGRCAALRAAACARSCSRCSCSRWQDPETSSASRARRGPRLWTNRPASRPAMRTFSAALPARQLKLRARIRRSSSAARRRRRPSAMRYRRSTSGAELQGMRSARRPTSKRALDRLAADPDGARRPVVLVTDGWENHGDADAALIAALARRAVSSSTSSRRRAPTNVPNVAMTELTPAARAGQGRAVRARRHAH